MWIWCIIPLLILRLVVGFGLGEAGEKAVCVGVCWEGEGVFAVGVASKESRVCCVGFGANNKTNIYLHFHMKWMMWWWITLTIK